MIQNGGFEEAGSTAAVPAGWTASFVSSLEEVADFDQNAADPTTCQESFEGGWAPDPQSLIAVFEGNTIDLETPVFNAGDVQSPIEGFERGWHAPVLTLIATLPGVESASFDAAPPLSSPEALEDFEEGWGEIDLVLPTGILIVTAMFDAVPQSFEDFGEGWGNDAYPVVPTLTAAVFDTNADVEDFEEVRAPELFTVNVATDKVEVVTALAPDIGEGFRFSADADGALPSPLSTTATYYSVGSIDLTGGVYRFLLSTTVVGSAIGFSSAGSGNRYIHRDPAQWWSALLSTV